MSFSNVRSHFNGLVMACAGFTVLQPQAADAALIALQASGQTAGGEIISISYTIDDAARNTFFSSSGIFSTSVFNGAIEDVYLTVGLNAPIQVQDLSTDSSNRLILRDNTPLNGVPSDSFLGSIPVFNSVAGVMDFEFQFSTPTTADAWTGSSIRSLDGATASLSQGALPDGTLSFTFNGNDYALAVTAVPEPSSSLLLILGGVGVICRRKRSEISQELMREVS